MAKVPAKSMTIVATFVSPGVAAGAAGFVIVGGKIQRVPPRGPAFKALMGASSLLVKGKAVPRT